MLLLRLPLAQQLNFKESSKEQIPVSTHRARSLCHQPWSQDIGCTQSCNGLTKPSSPWQNAWARQFKREDMRSQFQRFSSSILGRGCKNKQLTWHPGSGARKHLHSQLPPSLTVNPIEMPRLQDVATHTQGGFSPIMFYLLCQSSLKSHWGSTRRCDLLVSLIAVKPITLTVKISHHI